jgi:hypothetical protein
MLSVSIRLGLSSLGGNLLEGLHVAVGRGVEVGVGADSLHRTRDKGVQ